LGRFAAHIGPGLWPGPRCRTAARQPPLARDAGAGRRV